MVTKDCVKVSGAYYLVVSNVSSCTRLSTTSTPANSTVLRYWSLGVLYSNIVLDDSIMLVSFGLITTIFLEIE